MPTKTHKPPSKPTPLPEKPTDVAAPGDDDDAHGVKAAQSAAGRALAILRAVSASPRPLSSIDLHPQLRLPKATIHRLMQLLETLGYLEREPGSHRFIAGPALAALAIDSFINSPSKSVRHQILTALVAETNETCNITVLAGSEVVYVDRVEAHWPLRTHMQPGSRVPLHCGASGKLFLSFMRAQQRRQLLYAAPLRRLTDKTVVDPAKLEAELKRVKANELATDVEEFITGLIGVAVPVFDANNRMCATVSLHVPTVRCTPEQVLTFVPAMRRAAAAIKLTL